MKLWGAFAASALLLAAIGCGGGGGSDTGTPGGNGGGNGTVSLFATDNLIAGYDHVWVSVERVELTGPSGNRVIFEEAAGRVIDLRSLRDQTGRRFRLLSNRAISSGQFTGMTVTLAETATVFTTGATAGTEATFEGSTDGNKVLALTFPAPKTVGSGSKLIVDFDLANWNIEGGTISATNNAYLAVVEDTSLGNIDRHDRDEYKGNIGGLSGTAPTQSFTLTQGANTVRVVTDANTSIFHENGAASPTLANGVRVEVYGAFSAADNAIVASRIKIDDDNDNDEDEVKGRVTAFTAANNSITLDLIRSSGFVPTTTTITVQYADGIRFFGRRGTRFTVDEFEAALTNGGYIEAEGTLSGDVLTARKLKIEDGDDHGGHHGGGNHDGEAEVEGTASNADATAGTFRIAATEWEGMNLTNGATVNVVIGGGSELKVNGDNVSRAAFFAALTGGVRVKVEGTFDADTQTLTASEAKIGGNGGGGNGGGHGGDDD
ncbi:MAG: DUF5666 domain-containing protein [Fimbriimonas sp.]